MQNVKVLAIKDFEIFGACVLLPHSWSVDLVYPRIKQERNANFVPRLLKIVREILEYQNKRIIDVILFFSDI